MNQKFILSCESTVDLPFSYVSDRSIRVIFYSYTIDDKEHIDDRRDPDALPKFYEMLEKGDIPSTSQINEFRYEEFFEDQLKKVTFLILPSEQE